MHTSSKNKSVKFNEREFGASSSKADVYYSEQVVQRVSNYNLILISNIWTSTKKIIHWFKKDDNSLFQISRRN